MDRCNVKIRITDSIECIALMVAENRGKYEKNRRQCWLLKTTLARVQNGVHV